MILAPQTQAHAASQSMQLVGVYYAPSDVASSTRNELSPSIVRTAQSIGSKASGAAIALKVSLSSISWSDERL